MKALSLLGLVVLVGPAAAQSAPARSAAAASIIAADVAHRIGVIAADSMMGRDTPSRGLELTAQYVADQFQSFGLKPGGDHGWFQRYPITRRRLDLARSRVVFAAAGRNQIVGFTSGARFDGGAVPEKAVSGPALLVTGNQTAESAESIRVTGKVVIYVPPAGTETDKIQQILRTLYLAGPIALVTVRDVDSTEFSAAIPKRAPERTVIGTAPDRPVALQVRQAAIAGSLAGAGENPTRLGQAGEPVARELPELRVSIDMKDSVTSALSAPNTVGILPGTDPKLRDDYLVYSAHMDHIGITPGQPDSINNGADDDASGTVGVMELAKAFSRPGARPKRSIIFLTVSGEEKGLWGSKYFTEHPPVPIQQIVADINIDMIGRNWPDTIVAIGKEHSDLGATLNQVNAAHPELGMTAIDDRWPEERFYFRSDHYNFARKGVPILFFFNGVHEDYHEVTDSPDKINSDKEARILRLLFHLGQAVANAPKRPQWKPESYQEIVEEKTVSGR